MKTLLFLLIAVALHGQTTINGGRTFLGPVDASGATSTRPAKLGTAAPSSGACDTAGEEGAVYVRTGDPATVPTQVYVCAKTGASSWAWNPIGHMVQATAPTACVVGSVWFDSDATAGQNWFGCTSSGVWTLMSGAGGGVADPGANGIMARTALNTTAARMLTSSDSTISWANGNGVSANPDATINSALVLLRSTDQRGVNRYCASADSAGITYTCALSPTLNALDFVAGSTFIWNRTASCTSGTSLTLNIDGLGAKNVFAADGSTVLTTAECLAGRPLHLMYNGTHLRVIGGGAATGGVGDALVANPLSQFAATSSTQLRGVLSDETGGSGGAVFAGSPTITTPTIAGATVTGVADFSGATSFIAKRGTGAPSSTDCDASGEEGSIYVRTGDPASVPTQVYHCTKTGASSWAWHPISHKIGATDPATCDEGQLFYNTTSDTLRACTAANTWGAIGSGSSTGTARYYYKAGQSTIGGGYALGANFSAAPSTVAALSNLGDGYGGGFYLPDSAGNGVVLHHLLSDWTGTGNITFSVGWMWDGGGGGSGVWRIAVAAVCTAAGDGQTAIGSWNVAEATSSSQTNSDRIKIDSINIDTTGCATGESLLLHLYRDAADGADATTATAKIAFVELSYAKTL